MTIRGEIYVGNNDNKIIVLLIAYFPCIVLIKYVTKRILMKVQGKSRTIFTSLLYDVIRFT